MSEMIPSADQEPQKPTKENAAVPIQKSDFKEWLDVLGQHSWQLELLISGFVLFLILGARDKIESFSAYVEILEAPENTGFLLESMEFLVWISWEIFVINLITHIALRGIWIGSIGLRYVSGEINYRHLNYAPRFDNYLTRNVGSFDSFIEKLERNCSIVFAYTFLLFFIFMSLLLAFVVPFIVIASIIDIFGDLSNPEEAYVDFFIGVFFLIYGILGIIYLADFLTLGGIKKIKEKNISTFYFYVYILFSNLTLSWLYRPLLYNFLDNKFSRRLLWLSIPYFFVVVLLVPDLRINSFGYFLESDDEAEKLYAESETGFGRFMVDWSSYEDLRKQHFTFNPDLSPKDRIISVATLDRYVMDGAEAQLFLRINRRDDHYLEKIEKLPKVKNTGIKVFWMKDIDPDTSIYKLNAPFDKAVISMRQQRRNNPTKYTDAQWEVIIDSLKDVAKRSRVGFIQQSLNKQFEAYKSIFDIAIDSIDYNDSLVGRYYIHPNMGEKGLICRLPISSLAPGEHVLTLKRKFHFEDMNNDSKDTFSLREVAILPFIIRGSNMGE